jgi:hypothetical protein
VKKTIAGVPEFGDGTAGASGVSAEPAVSDSGVKKIRAGVPAAASDVPAGQHSGALHPMQVTRQAATTRQNRRDPCPAEVMPFSFPGSDAAIKR